MPLYWYFFFQKYCFFLDLYVLYGQDHRLFKQRYFEFLDYYRADGPIFLRICGESACNGIANDYTAVSPL